MKVETMIGALMGILKLEVSNKCIHIYISTYIYISEIEYFSQPFYEARAFLSDSNHIRSFRYLIEV